MFFNEKLKSLRNAHDMTQDTLAQKLGITKRALANYESGKRIPKHETLIKISEIFDVSLDYLLAKEDDFISNATKKYGTSGKIKAKQIVAETSGLFAAGELDEEDKDAFFRSVTEIYFESKERAKKYTPQKYKDKS